MRTPARLLGLVVSFVVISIAGAGAAFADEPASDAWPAAPERSHLDQLILFGGGTVGLIVVITLLALLTARNNYVPPAPGNELQKAPDGTIARH